MKNKPKKYLYTLISKIDYMPKKKQKTNHPKIEYKCSGAGTVYGLGLIGALIYFLSTSTGFWSAIIGIAKSIVWPVFLVYELFHFLAL